MDKTIPWRIDMIERLKNGILIPEDREVVCRAVNRDALFDEMLGWLKQYQKEICVNGHRVCDLCDVIARVQSSGKVEP
jgi:hypothetical protein